MLRKSLLLICAFMFVASDSFAAFRPCKKPTNISKFKDSSYYKGTNALKGENLKSALNLIIKGHRAYSYNCVWTILKESDEDPNNSSNVILLYTGRSHAKSDRVSQSNNSDDAWNREHVWAKSHGLNPKTVTDTAMRTI